MEKPERSIKGVKETFDDILLNFRILDIRFCHLYIPIAEFMPYKLIYVRCCIIKPVFFKGLVHTFGRNGKSAQYPPGR